MKIYGFQKTTLLDYPEHVAATIFTGGCNFRCPFCQNGGLVLEPGKYGEIPEEEVWKHLEKRKGILDGVCITGGEPTLQPDLEEFICRVKDMGYAVKLDTNGYRPEVVGRLLEQGLLDYVAMDVKACKENYARAVGLIESVSGHENEGTLRLREDVFKADCMKAAELNRKGYCGSAVAGFCSNFELHRIEQTIGMLMDSGISYEFRTTAVKGLHMVEEFGQIGEWLAGSRAYFIQSYREDGEVLQKDGLGSFSLEELQEMARLAGKYIPHVELRGVDG